MPRKTTDNEVAKASQTPRKRAKSEIVKVDNKTPKRQTKVSQAVCEDRCKTPRRSTRLNIDRKSAISQSAKPEPKPKSVTKRRYSVHELGANDGLEKIKKTDDAKFRKTLFSVGEEKNEESETSSIDFPGFNLSEDESIRSTRKFSAASAFRFTDSVFDKTVDVGNKEAKFTEELSETFKSQNLEVKGDQQANEKGNHIDEKKVSMQYMEIEVDSEMNNAMKEEDEAEIGKRADAEIGKGADAKVEEETKPKAWQEMESEAMQGLKTEDSQEMESEAIQEPEIEKETESEEQDTEFLLPPQTESDTITKMAIEHCDLSSISESLGENNEESSPKIVTDSNSEDTKDRTFEINNSSELVADKTLIEKVENCPAQDQSEISQIHKKLNRPSIIDLTDSPSSSIKISSTPAATPTLIQNSSDCDFIEIPDTPAVDSTTLAIYSPIRYQQTPIVKKAIVTNEPTSLRSFILKKTTKRLQQTPFKSPKLMKTDEDVAASGSSLSKSLGKKFGIAEKLLKGLITPQNTTPIKGIRKRSFSVTDVEKKNVTFKENIEEHQENIQPQPHQPSSVARKRQMRKRSMSNAETELAKIPILKAMRGAVDSPSKTNKAIKMPNFASIHNKQMNKMESLLEYTQRKNARAKVLLSAKNSALKSVNAKVQNPSRPIDISAQKSLFQFVSDKLTNSHQLQPDSKNAFLCTKSTAVVPATENTRLEHFKQRTKKDLNAQRTAQAKIIKGVRSNRRFELQMEFRKNVEEMEKLNKNKVRQDFIQLERRTKEATS